MEIYYPDGTVGIVSESRLENPPMNVVNPRAKEGAASRASSKQTIVAKVNGKDLIINVGFWGVTTKEISPDSKRIMRDAQGIKVRKKEYIVSTEMVIDDAGRGDKYVNDDGKEVLKDDLRWFVVQPDGTEKEVVQFVKTDEVLINLKPSGTEDGYLVHDNYELVADTDDDKEKLWELVQYLKGSNQIGVGLVVMSKGWKRYGVLFVPYVDEKNGKFALIAKTTQKKFTLDRPQEIPKPTEKKAKKPQIAAPGEELFK